MSENYIAEQTFDREDFSIRALPKAEYENCKFINCNFANSDLSGVKFLDCEFNACNLSMASLTKTALNDIHFSDCKMLGLRFENCNDFGLAFTFNNCKLDHSSFYKLKLKKTSFKIRSCKKLISLKVIYPTHLLKTVIYREQLSIGRFWKKLILEAPVTFPSIQTKTASKKPDFRRQVWVVYYTSMIS